MKQVIKEIKSSLDNIESKYSLLVETLETVNKVINTFWKSDDNPEHEEENIAISNLVSTIGLVLDNNLGSLRPYLDLSARAQIKALAMGLLASDDNEWESYGKDAEERMQEILKVLEETQQSEQPDIKESLTTKNLLALFDELMLAWNIELCGTPKEIFWKGEELKSLICRQGLSNYTLKKLPDFMLSVHQAWEKTFNKNLKEKVTFFDNLARFIKERGMSDLK